jgi:nucleoside-diphosphate-sugar epimerase
MTLNPRKPPLRILLTGATGYIGGTVLHHLLTSSLPALASKPFTLTVLVREASRAATLTATWGIRVHAVVYAGLDDTATTTLIASQHDLVINMTLGFHAASAQALLAGLALRKAETGREVYMLHLSGASNLADQPVSGAYAESREFDDLRDDVYGYERMREALRAYHQRSTELGVIDTSLELGVRTVVVMPPLVFGKGRGLFNQVSVQIPVYVEAALKRGQAVVVGDGSGEIDHVHVEDLAELYAVLVEEILENGGERLPRGRKGIVFASNGRHTWMEVAQRVNEALSGEEGRVVSLSLEEGAEAFKGYVDLVGGEDLTELELGLCSNSRSVASVARSLGWKPSRGEEDWIKGFRDDVEAVLQRRK